MLPHLCFMLRHTSVCTSVTCNLFSLAGGFFFSPLLYFFPFFSFFLSVLTPDLFYIQSPLQLQWWWAVPWLIKYSGEVAMAAAWSWEGIQIVTSRCHTHWHRECLKSPDQTQGTPQAHNLCPPALNGVNNTQKGTVPLGPRLWREFNNHQSTQVCMPHPCNYHVIGVGVPTDTTYVTSTQPPLSLILIQSMSIKMKRTGAGSYTVFLVLRVGAPQTARWKRGLGGAEFQSLQLFRSDLEQEECAYNNNRFKHCLHTGKLYWHSKILIIF